MRNFGKGEENFWSGERKKERKKKRCGKNGNGDSVKVERKLKRGWWAAILMQKNAKERDSLGFSYAITEPQRVFWVTVTVVGQITNPRSAPFSEKTIFNFLLQFPKNEPKKKKKRKEIFFTISYIQDANYNLSVTLKNVFGICTPSNDLECWKH